LSSHFFSNTCNIALILSPTAGLSGPAQPMSPEQHSAAIEAGDRSSSSSFASKATRQSVPNATHAKQTCEMAASTGISVRSSAVAEPGTRPSARCSGSPVAEQSGTTCRRSATSRVGRVKATAGPPCLEQRACAASLWQSSGLTVCS